MLYVQYICQCLAWLLAAGFAGFAAIKFVVENSESAEAPCLTVPMVWGQVRALLQTSRLTAACIAECVLCSVCAWHVAAQAIGITACVGLCTCHALLLCAAVIDSKLRVIPNAIALVMILIRLAIMLLLLATGGLSIHDVLNSAVALTACALLMLVARILSKKGVGMGDVKLVAATGFLCGVSAVVYAMFFAMLVLAICAVFLLASGRKTGKDSLPFAPFLYLGYSLTLVFSLY